MLQRTNISNYGYTGTSPFRGSGVGVVAGNVLTVFSDKTHTLSNTNRTTPYIVSTTDYDPFGMIMNGRNWNAGEYRFGFNGQEKDHEIYNNQSTTTATFWEYDGRIGRRWNIDPKPTFGVSDYACFLNNPIWFNDPFGDEVDGDKKGMENYKNYRKEVNSRADALKNKMKGLDEKSDDYSKLNTQLQAYDKINTELNTLEADKKNLYYINSDVTFEENQGDEKTEGMTYYQGTVNRNGNEMKQINIDLSKQQFPMSNMAHEFKHASQYYEGRLIFGAGTKGGFNSQELEHEAFERGDRFKGKTMQGNNKFNMNYSYKPVFATENYKELELKVNTIFEQNTKMQIDIINKKGLKYIYNDPTEK